MNKNIKNTLRLGIIAAASAAAMVSCSDTWDDHYNGGPASLSFQGTTMEALEEKAPNFAKVVKLYGYDRELTSENIYTVWAPADGTFNLSDYADVMTDNNGTQVLVKKADADDVVDHFIKNHVARYANSQDGSVQDILLMNSKIATMTGEGVGDGTEGMFGDRPIKKSNLTCTNGVLHIIDGELSYKVNLFEKIKELYNPETDDISLYAFLKKYDADSLDESKSVSNGVDSLSNPIWEDSVTIRNNTILKNVDALLYREDSSYIAIIPSAEAYRKRVEIAKRLLVFNPYEDQILAGTCDSLQSYFANMFALTDLFYNKNLNAKAWDEGTQKYDSLRSTNYSVFDWPYNLYYSKEPRLGMHPDKQVNDILAKCGTPVECSNGDAYLVDEYPMEVTEQFFKKMTVRANARTLDQTKDKDGNTTLYTKSIGDPSMSSGYIYDYKCDTIWDEAHENIVRVDSTYLGSRQYYFYDIPEHPGSQPTIAFQLDNTLSGTYDIYLVTCPIWAKNGFNNGETYEDDPRSYRFYTNIYERTSDYTYVGTPTRLTPPEGAGLSEGNYFITDYHNKIDTLYLGEYTFKNAYYNRPDAGVLIQFDVKIGSKLTDAYSREMLISSIILRPKFDAMKDDAE